MRVRKIEIIEWRNFRNVTIDLADDASLICLVGANGTGKSQILELIAACAHQIGLSSGVEIPRGNPFNDEVRNFSIEFYLAPNVSEALDEPIGDHGVYASWDRTIRFDGQSNQPFAGGVADEGQSTNLAWGIINALHQSKEVHFLTLDADRAFPKRDLNTHEMVQAFETQWENSEWNKGRSFQTTRTLYDEWIKYCLAKENK